MEETLTEKTVEERIDDVIELIRPAIQADGGDLEFVGFDDGVVTVEMLGACVGCALSDQTMTAGVERILKDKVAEVKAVIAR